MAYKLYYFNFRGAAEPIRYLLAYGNIDYEDVRFEREEWPKHKESMPLKQVPVLEIDGKKLPQSVAICRLLAKKVGLVGDNDMENFEIDSVVDTFLDLKQKVVTAVFYTTDEDKKAEAIKKLQDETFPFYFNLLNEIAETNNGHLALKKLTWVDVMFAAQSTMIAMGAPKGEDLWAKYPALKRVIDNVESNDAIKKWITERPATDF